MSDRLDTAALSGRAGILAPDRPKIKGFQAKIEAEEPSDSKRTHIGVVGRDAHIAGTEAGATLGGPQDADGRASLAASMLLSPRRGVGRSSAALH